MGWTTCRAEHYKENGNVDRKKECEMLLTDGLNKGHLKVRKSVMKGSTFYAAVEIMTKYAGKVNGNDTYEPVPEENRKTIGVVILTSVTSSDYWNFSYKMMEESVGPAECDCPESILKLLSETDDEFALAWRKKCRERESIRKVLRGLPLGTEIFVTLPNEKMAFKRQMYRGKKMWLNWDERKKISDSNIVDCGFEYKVSNCDECDLLVIAPYHAFCKKDIDVPVSWEQIPESCPFKGMIPAGFTLDSAV